MFPVVIFYSNMPTALVTDLTQPMSAKAVLKLWLEWQGIPKEHQGRYTAQAITNFTTFENIKG